MNNYAVAVAEPIERAPDGEPELTSADVAAINQRLQRLREQWGGLRVEQAEFRIPWPLTRSQYEQRRKEAVDAWLTIMEKKGWELRSKVHVKGLKPAYGYHGDWQAVPLLDHKSVRVLAAFQIKRFEAVRLEVPVVG